MWQNHIVCLVSERLKDHVHDVESSQEETGFGHVIPNKGGLALSLYIGDTSLCFVSSHLAALEGQAERRCADYAEIIDGIRLGAQNKPLTNQFTHVIWVGDLNFRIDMSDTECHRLVGLSDWTALYKQDQLNKMQTQQKAFYLFNEGELNFPPTYKHVPGTPPDVASGRRDYKLGKGHTPSWCDRVLWRSFPDTVLELRPGTYKSTPSIFTSDHSPVSAVFNMTVPRPAWATQTGTSAVRQVHQFGIEMTKLRGRGLLKCDVVGLSDPFLIFTSRCLDGSSQTSVKSNTLEPEWLSETIVLKTKCFFCDPDQLATWHVLVSVFDKDYFDQADTMGHGVISLMDAAAAPGYAHPFTVQLSKSGGPAGILEGEVAIQRI